MSSLEDELDEIRTSKVPDDLDDEIDMDETVDAPAPPPQGVRDLKKERDIQTRLMSRYTIEVA